jgi:hypothetical protein
VVTNPISREEFIRTLLRAYCTTPGTTGSIRRQDRLLAAQLYERGVPLIAVQNAFLLAASRRLFHPAAAPLPSIRSLAYFLAVIDEVLGLHVSQDYFHHLRNQIARFRTRDST